MNEKTEIENGDALIFEEVNPGAGANLIAEAVGAAEDIPDPLDGLVEKSATDPGAAFAPENLELLATLKKEDRAAFEVLRSKLKKAGCRVTALDEAIAKESGDMGNRGPTQADILIGLAQTAELFHTPDGSGFADVEINGHRETWPIRSKGFRRWLARSFFEATESSANRQNTSRLTKCATAWGSVAPTAKATSQLGELCGSLSCQCRTGLTRSETIRIREHGL